MRNFNYSFNIILRLLEIDSIKRETDRYKNIYYSGKRELDTEKRIKHQNSIEKLGLDRH